jgi:undecaprenyl-diphosphatase
MVAGLPLTAVDITVTTQAPLSALGIALSTVATVSDALTPEFHGGRVSFAATVGAEQLSYVQAIVIGALQGITELFPVSSLGHSVLVPALVGGSWKDLVTQGTDAQSPYLSFIVALHVATALALLCFYWRDWVRIVGGFISSIRKRSIDTPYEKLAWLIIIATIPAGIIGLALEHALRSVFAKPEFAAIFLTINGLILFLGEWLRRRSVARSAALTGEKVPAHQLEDDGDGEAQDLAIINAITRRDAGFIGVLQSAALLAGISRSGITMVAGLVRGLDHELSVRFAFLLATPIILAAGVYKLPSLAGQEGAGIHGQILAGSVAAFLAALVSIVFLTRWFKTRTLTPFAVYCVAMGLFCTVYFA